jgi:outer membrane protein
MLSVLWALILCDQEVIVYKKTLSALNVLLLAALFVQLFTLPVYSASYGDLLYYYNLALKNDPQLKGAEYESLATRETLRQEYAGLLPKIYGDVSYSLTYQSVNSSDNQVYAAGSTDYDTRTFGVSLVQPIFRYSSFVGIGQAKAILNRSEMELEKARQELALRVAEAYMSVLLSRDKLAAVKAEEAAVDAMHLRARERYEKGLAPITDRYDTEARLAAVKAQLVEAENSLKDSFQSIAEICGVQPDEIKPLKEEVPLAAPFPEDVKHWTAAGLKQNLEILIHKSKAEIAEMEIDRQRSAHAPTLDFKFDLNNTDTKGSLFGGGSNTTNYVLMFKLNIPIYEGGLISSKTREASNLQQSAMQGVSRQSRAVERKVLSAYNGVSSAMARVQAMKKSVDAQQMVVEAKQEGFRSGLYISLAVLDAMQDLYKYKREYSQARNDYILNSFRLKHAVGTLKPEELKLVNEWLQN